MPTHDMLSHAVAVMLDEAFAALQEAGEVDVVINQGTSEYDVQADDWTLHLEGWPLDFGFLALDDEPATDAERRAALDAALDERHLAAMRKLNHALNGSLATVLAASGDALSILLGGVLDNEDATDLLDSLDP